MKGLVVALSLPGDVEAGSRKAGVIPSSWETRMDDDKVLVEVGADAKDPLHERAHERALREDPVAAFAA